MVAAPASPGRRERLARGILRSGALSALSLLPARDSLLVLTYHRIGDRLADPWDPGVFSATAEEFDQHVSYFKREFTLVTLDEALEFIEGKATNRTATCRVLFTFDDGYLDNYQIAFPILKSHGAQGVFFLCSSLVGSGYVPWWDHVAYLVKSGVRRNFTLQYPDTLEIDIDREGMVGSLRHIFAHYRSAGNKDPEGFLRELKEAVGGKELPVDARRFVDWNEAREMIAGGMAIGAHTQTHTMLSKLPVEEQRNEFVHSRAALREKLGVAADVLAYPFGGRSAFTAETQRIAAECGFRAAFSFYGCSANRFGSIERYNVKRVCVGVQSWSRMRVQAGIARATGKFLP